MELYLGGCFQGKLSYVTEKYQNLSVWEGEDLSTNSKELWEQLGDLKSPIINHFQNLIRSCLINHVHPMILTQEIVARYPDVIIICDEVGNGIVPIDPQESEYREQTGRVQIFLAKRAERVERIICGISQQLK